MQNTMSLHPLVLHTRVVSGTGGGPEKTILNSPRFLRQHGFDCVCVYFRHPHDPGFQSIEQKAVAADAALVGVDDHGAADFRLVGRLRELLEPYRGRRVIWHGHDYKSNLAGLWLRRRFPLTLVSTVHGWVLKTWKSPAYYALDRWCLRRYDRVICVSDDLLLACQRAGIAAERLERIPNAIDLQQVAWEAPSSTRLRTRQQAKAELDWPADRLLVLAVGRLSAEKGLGLLIAAVIGLIRQGHDVGLVIVGDGPEREALQQQIAASGVADRIRLDGFLPQLERHYQAADLFALSSLREGLPNVLLEAMAYGLPVVATAIAGIPKLIEEGREGLLVPSGQADALSAAIRSLVGDAALRAQLGSAARKKVEANHCFAKRMQRMAGIYREVISG